MSQAVGGAVVLAGLAVARQGDRGEHADPERATQIERATRPDLPLREAAGAAND